LLSAELLINLAFFFLLKEKIKNVFASLLTSILISKAIYYLLKLGVISFGLLDDKLFSTPFYFQIIAAIVLSTYMYFVNRTDRNYLFKQYHLFCLNKSTRF